MNKIQCIFLFALLIFSACSVNVTATTPEYEKVEEKPARNIILMVGDGMGLTQISSGLYRNKSLNLERIQSIGLSKTSSSVELVTDSAAGATAFSIGEKTYNGAIGVDENKVAKETILESLGKSGYSTGLIATCAITHATPASFYAHQPQRSMGYEIAADMVNSPLTLFVGGGKSHFVNRNDDKNGAPDNRNIVEELERNGFTFVNSLTEMENTNGKVGYFLADTHPESIKDGRDDILPRSIDPVIRHLQKESDKGFFLMVEGAQIDWGGHANDSEYIITEMVDFDKAIGEVLDFAEKDGNTLVIITADHETGGYALKGKNNNYNELEGSFTTGGHTATMVPVFAYGPGEKHFRGIYNNNEIYHKMKQAMN